MSATQAMLQCGNMTMRLHNIEGQQQQQQLIASRAEGKLHSEPETLDLDVQNTSWGPFLFV